MSRADVVNALLYAPPPQLSEPEKLDRSIRYAVSVVGRWQDGGRIRIPLLEPAVTEAARTFTPVFQRKGFSDTSWSLVGYEVAALSFVDWGRLYLASEEAATLIKERMAFNLSQGFQMDSEANHFMSAVVRGMFSGRPRQPGTKQPYTHRDTLLSGIAKRVSRAFGYHVGASKATFLSSSTPPICGSTIAAAALYGFGIPIRPERAHKVATETALPVDLAEELGVFLPEKTVQHNALAGYLPPEFCADASEFQDNLAAARRYLETDW